MVIDKTVMHETCLSATGVAKLPEYGTRRAFLRLRGARRLSAPAVSDDDLLWLALLGCSPTPFVFLNVETYLALVRV